MPDSDNSTAVSSTFTHIDADEWVGPTSDWNFCPPVNKDVTPNIIGRWQPRDARMGHAQSRGQGQSGWFLSHRIVHRRTYPDSARAVVTRHEDSSSWRGD